MKPPSFITIVRMLCEMEKYIKDERKLDTFYENLQNIINISMCRLGEYPLSRETIAKHIDIMFLDATTMVRLKNTKI
jgi:hypothetical protein